MAKIYHNGEYVSGGTTASTVNTYYVEITENSSQNPIILPEKYYHDDGNELREHKLVIRNVSPDTIEIHRLYVKSSDDKDLYIPTESIVPSYRDLIGFSVSSIPQYYIKNPPDELGYGSYIRLEPHVSHEFFYNRTAYVQMDRYFAKCISCSSQSNVLLLYVEQNFRASRQYPFILSGYIGDTSGYQLTVGTITYDPLDFTVRIGQENILGSSKISRVQFYNTDGGEVTGSDIYNILNRAFSMRFVVSRPEQYLGYNCRYVLHLFT